MIANLIIATLIACLVLEVVFANVMIIHRQAKASKGIIKYLLYIGLFPLAIVGYLYDVAFNLTFGSLIFLQFPRLKLSFNNSEWTLTARLWRYIHDAKGWRFDVAYWVCKYLIEFWDAGHCGLDKLNPSQKQN